MRLLPTCTVYLPQYYEMAIGLCPRRASSFAALAFAHHLQGSLDLAIEYYHRALGLKPDDSFSSEMLFKALEDVLHTGTPTGTPTRWPRKE